MSQRLNAEISAVVCLLRGVGLLLLQRFSVECLENFASQL
jgi:hypothetical protein